LLTTNVINVINITSEHQPATRAHKARKDKMPLNLSIKKSDAILRQRFNEVTEEHYHGADIESAVQAKRQQDIDKNDQNKKKGA
jgi:hypothetical protein